VLDVEGVSRPPLFTRSDVFVAGCVFVACDFKSIFIYI